MKKSAAAASALAVGAFASGAQAQDAGAEHEWTGFYVGLGAGLVGAEGDWQIDGGEAFFAPPDGSAQTSEDVGAFAAQAGYNHQFGSIVVGGEADYAATNVDDETFFDGGEGANLRSEINHIGTVRARVGYAMDEVLLFATAGVAFSDGEHTFNSLGSPPTETVSTDVGWVAGGGVELAVSENVSLAVQAMFASFGGEDGLADGPFYDDRFEVETDVILARFGVNYRF